VSITGTSPGTASSVSIVYYTRYVGV
jgi:hypothetical protein